MTTSTHSFAAPVFRGGRFESGLLSIDVLPDLAAYRDLVVELAKHLLLQQRNRKRVPKGFVESFQLGIQAIQQGSAVTILERIPPQVEPGAPLPLLPNTDDYFDRAREVIAEAIGAVVQGTPLPSDFPKELGRRFNQFGRGLRDDEYVVLNSPGKTSGPRYDKKIRKRIIIQCIGQYEDEFDIAGTVSGGDVNREIISIHVDGGFIEGKCPADLVRHALKHLLEQPVRVIGLGAYDRNERLERILRVDELLPAIDDEDGDISPAADAPSSLDAQFDDLKALEPGWFDSDTPALDAKGIDAFRSFLARVLTSPGIPRPYIYPTPEAEARAEWSLSDWEVSVLPIRLFDHVADRLFEMHHVDARQRSYACGCVCRAHPPITRRGFAHPR